MPVQDKQKGTVMLLRGTTLAYSWFPSGLAVSSPSPVL